MNENFLEVAKKNKKAYYNMMDILNELYQKKDFNEVNKKENTIDINYMIEKLQPVFRSLLQSKLTIDAQFTIDELNK